jgi:hypothetical protein
LHDAGDEAVHFVKIDLGLNAHHLSIPSVMERKQKARRRGRRRASLVPISLAVYFRPWQSAGMEVPWWW